MQRQEVWERGMQVQDWPKESAVKSAPLASAGDASARVQASTLFLSITTWLGVPLAALTTP